MDVQVGEPGWSYHVVRISNVSLSILQSQLNQLGTDGWELVTSVSTVKTILNIAGNDLVFVFKKPGMGHTFRDSIPSIEQQAYVVQLLKDRGFVADEIDGLNNTLQRRGLWTAQAIYDVSAEWQHLDRAGIKAWMLEPIQGSE